jgi:flavin reductase ActVB
MGARESFVRVMAQLAGGAVIVTAKDADGAPRGLTTTAVCSVSAEPPLLLACVARSSRTVPALTTGGAFAVNVLGSSHLDVCRSFASKAEDKFAGVEWREGVLGQPLLEKAAIAWAECEVEQIVEAGDHLIFIGAFRHGEVASAAADPIVHYQRSFGRWNEIEE